MRYLEIGVYFLQLYEGKKRIDKDFHVGAAAAPAGTGEAAAAHRGDATRIAGEALCHLWTSRLQVRAGRTTRPRLVSHRDLGTGRTTSAVVPPEQAERVRRWIANYRRVKNDLEKISQINRELLQRERKRRARP